MSPLKETYNAQIQSRTSDRDHGYEHERFPQKLIDGCDVFRFMQPGRKNGLTDRVSFHSKYPVTITAKCLRLGAVKQSLKRILLIPKGCGK